MTNLDSRVTIGDFQTVVRSGDPVVSDHRVHGTPVLPGVALLDAVMRAATIGGHDPAGIELSNVLFEAPVTVPDGDERRLVFRSTDHSGQTRVVIRTRTAGADEQNCAECLVRPIDPARPANRLDVAAIRHRIATGEGRPLADLYRTTGGLGIDHREFMRAHGTVLPYEEGLVAELALGEAAHARRADFFLPPTFLDAAVVVAVADALSEAGSAFLPVFISRFRAWERPADRVYVVTGKPVRRGDALETDLWLYNADGRLIVTLERLTAMRARTEQPAAVQPVATVPRPSRRLQIAVVGMSGRYPGASNLDELWDNLAAGRETTGRVPAGRWNPAEYETSDRKLSRFGGFLDDVDKFDPLFFRIPPSGVALLDPQERLFLEAAYGAIENAGYQPEDFTEPGTRVGVFVGATWTDYRMLAAEAAKETGAPTAVSALSSIANRVSYTFNFTGPSLVVDTACSASLTALHLACRSIADGECDAAVTGGVNLLLHPEKYLIYSQMNLVSSDGKLRAFGANGDGHVPGEGVGAFLLKPLDRAIADGDTVHGVILATAVNHGGQAAGYTVPQPGAQAAVIRRALDESEVDPDSIGYVEAHGTGTALGDPVEIIGLTKAYSGRTRPLPVGSIKSNIGHLESAAGVVGVSRALLQFRHGQITPSLNSEVLNPEIDFDSTPFYVPQRAEPFPRQTVDGRPQPRRSSISSFGAGGSNAHVVIEEYLAPSVQDTPGTPELVVLSARSTERLRVYAERLASHLRGTRQHTFTDIARTLQVGRPALSERLAFVASSVPEIVAGLERFLAGDNASVCVGTARHADDSALTRHYQARDLSAAARAWADGATPDWAALNDGPKRRVPLPGYPFERTSFWVGGRDNSDRSLLAKACESFEATLVPITEELEAIFPAMGRYAAAALHRRFTELGVSSGTITLAQVRKTLNVIPEYERFIDACLAVLERHGGIRTTGSVIEVLPERADPVRLRSELLDRSPETAPFIRFVDTCLRAYPEVLSGRTPATQVLFADSSMDLMAGVYRGNRVYDFYSELVARFVAHAAEVRSKAGVRPVRILELGAGTGGTSHAALAALAGIGRGIEYYYTDVGGSFVAHGRRTFGPDYPFARFQLFNMEKEPQEQGFQPGSVDVLLVVGALHAVADIDATLRRLRGLLAPSGVLVLGEAIEDHDVMAVAAGLFAGWTLYRDADRRLPHSPLLSEQAWQTAFARAGFEGFTSYGPGLTADAAPGHRVMVAARPENDTEVVAEPVEIIEPVKTAVVTKGEPLDEDEAAEQCEPLIAEIVASALGIGVVEIQPERSFADYGVDSILAVTIVNQVNERFGLSIKPTALFDYPSVRDLTYFAVSEGAQPTPVAEVPVVAPAVVVTRAPEPAVESSDIAVIGIAGRYPGADDYRELWRNLAAGRDSVTEVPRERWDIDEYFQAGSPVAGKTYSRWGGYLSDVDKFDPLFFGISPGEADLIDPQQRLFLQESWKAIEDAGLDPRGLKGQRCGVFVGAPPSDYMSLIRERGLFAQYGVFTGNSPAILPARIAYHLDLVGPCVAVDTACSSSLVAIHQACRSLADGECDMALAGGVAVFSTPEHHQLSASLGMLSPTGRCRPFDAAGDGLALSEGVGVVVLKPLARAIADGDPVYGVIRGSAVNQDGRTNGITAPSARSQTALELDVYRRFGIDPSTISYVEAHGTGTKLGDPIEVEALTTAFRQYTDRRQFVALGSIKSNIGHSSHAAGVAGLIKVLLAMRTRQLPPSLHFDTPNPMIGFEDTPFFVNTELRPWDSPLRRAAVSSFGFSGTNCHIVVDEHVDTRPPTARATRAVIPLSSQTEDGLRQSAEQLARFLAEEPETDLHDLAATLQTGRAAFDHRLVVVADSVTQLRERLMQGGPHVDDAEEPAADRPVRRINLPGYVFARDRCWVPDTSDAPSAAVQLGTSKEIMNPSPVELRTRAEDYLKGILAAEARLPVERLKSRAPLEEYGIESVLIAKLTRRLEQDFGALPSTLFFEYQTLGELAEYFAQEHGERLEAIGTPHVTAEVSAVDEPRVEVVERSTGRSDLHDIAVIGMAGRFPKAGDVDELWQNLVTGRDCITEVPPGRWDHSAYLSDDPEQPGTTYARWGGFIDDVDRFDARFFGVSPKDAEAMDPQQRLFLESAWAALEDAGYSPERARRTARRRGTKDVGVFAGVTYGEYQLLVGIPIAGYWAVANRVSYHFGFNGPSMAVDTACSSSLTAVHLACESLRRGECGYAVAGGVNVTIHPGKYLLLGMGQWASTDGRCRTFGAGGDGYVPGEGVATLLLKPLADALADGDRVYGVIRASAANQDGRTNGFTVPSPNAQAELVREALTDADIDPRTLSYVEAHGTGTSLGDPIEIAALTKAFRRSTTDAGYCAIGSAKSSIGHLEAAAGVAGLVKVLLQMRHDTIAPSLHAEPPNPNIDFENSPFRVAVRAEPWTRDGGARIAAVSSFGAGGSNVHVVLADGPQTPVPAAVSGSRLVVLSARRSDRLTEQVRNLVRFLRSERGRDTSLADVAWTLAVGREAFEHRLAIVATDHDELAARLEEFADGRTPEDVATGVADTHEPAGGESSVDTEFLAKLVARGELGRVGKLWTQGWLVDWEAVADNGSRARIVSLPTYPFARDRYWIQPSDYLRDGAVPQVTEPKPTAPKAIEPAPVASGELSVRDDLEQRMKEIFADLTKSPIDEMDVHADFLDFGFDSVVTVRMLNRLMKSYGVRIPGSAIEEYTTIRSFADYVIEAGFVTGGGTVRGVDPRIAPVVTAPAQQPEKLVLDEPIPVESIFITGVTGVLGGKLLYDLLSDTRIRINCLVRGEDEAVARERVRYFLDVYDVEGLLVDDFEQRVGIVLGDVSLERMGLDDATWAELAATTDMTIHAAARTTLVSFYDALAPVNVEGTRRAIDFALDTRHKYLVYVSSFSALGDWQIYNNPPFRESDIELGQAYDNLPYQETKYHSEKLIRAATAEGLVWNIFRPGNIMGDSTNGRYPFAEVTVKGVFYDIFKTIAETGIAMLSPNHWDVSPVNYVSAGLLHLALRRPSYRETYHLTNPDVRSLYEIFTLIGDFGYATRPVSIDEFHRYATERLFRKFDSDEVYESQTIEMVKYGIEIWGREHYEQSAYPDSTYTRSILGPAGIDCPSIAELVPDYLRHCIEVGYLAPPPTAAGGAADADRPVAVVFPGQGAQKLGMAADYHERFAIARDTFAEASEAAGVDLARICFEDNDKLRLTEFTQPCLLTAEIAAYRVASEEFGLRAELFGGHSVGEYTALVAAGAIPLADAVRLVRKRGALMQQAMPEGEGTMAALILDDIEESGAVAIVTALGAEVANHNSPGQIAISGSVGCLEKVRHALDEALPELDFVPLKVSGAFHSRFMRPVEADFEACLRDCADRLVPDRATVVTSNLTGGFHDPDALVGNLVRQLSSPVRWQDNMAALAGRAGRIFEIGPRGSLSKFFRAVGHEVTPITKVVEAEQRLGVALD